MSECGQSPARGNSALLKTCQWPSLPQPYDGALRAAVAFVLQRVPDVTSILACGSILRGVPSPSSDLDIYVLHTTLSRQRIQRWFNGVPAEIFVNPPSQVRMYMEKEQRQGRPITAHMVATGYVVLALETTLEELRALAREMLSGSPGLSDQQLIQAKYLAASRFEDATDIWGMRPEAARMILDMAVYDMLRYHYLAHDRFVPRAKDLLNVLGTLAPALADIAKQYYRACSPDRALALAHQIADRTIGTYGFFEWESDLEDLRHHEAPRLRAPVDDTVPGLSVEG